MLRIYFINPINIALLSIVLPTPPPFFLNTKAYICVLCKRQLCSAKAVATCWSKLRRLQVGMQKEVLVSSIVTNKSSIKTKKPKNYDSNKDLTKKFQIYSRQKKMKRGQTKEDCVDTYSLKTDQPLPQP